MARTMIEVIEDAGEFAHGGEDISNHAWYWEHAGFTPEEADAWINEARCFHASAAAMMHHARITPDEAALREVDAFGIRTETLGYRVANGDISVETAEKIIEEAWYRE